MSGIREKDLDCIVRDLLASIDDELTKSHKSWGSNVVTYTMPVSFNLEGLEKKDAQRVVYSKILRSLERRGFDSRISLSRNRAILYIFWVANLSQEDLTKMDNYVKSKLIEE